MKVLILGASGLVGRNALEQTLAQPSVTEVIAPARKPLPPRSKLTNPAAEQLELLVPEVSTWRADAVICVMVRPSRKLAPKKHFARSELQRSIRREHGR